VAFEIINLAVQKARFDENLALVTAAFNCAAQSQNRKIVFNGDGLAGGFQSVGSRNQIGGLRH
jgi:hypothetical protein